MFAVCISLLLFTVSAAAGRSCQEEQAKAEREYSERIKDDLLEYFYVPQCDGDTWQALQVDSSNQRWCVDETTGEEISISSDRLVSCTGCLAKQLVALQNIQRAEESRARINNIYIPDCQDDDSDLFDLKQCWQGYFEACWCVDPVSGDPLTHPTHANEVNCATLVDYPIPKCSLLESLTNAYYDNYLTISGRPADVRIHLQCDQQGYFQTHQCIQDVCWCVDQITGLIGNCKEGGRNKRYSAWNRCRETREAQFKTYYEFILAGAMVEQITVPTCTNVGDWEEVQCSGQLSADTQSACWCVDKDTGEPTTLASKGLTSCTGCLSHQMRTAHAGIEDMTVCQEDDEDKFLPVQCDEERCWCVDVTSGRVLYGPNWDVTGELCEQLNNSESVVMKMKLESECYDNEMLDLLLDLFYFPKP
eukprot:sb/3465058/